MCWRILSRGGRRCSFHPTKGSEAKKRKTDKIVQRLLQDQLSLKCCLIAIRSRCCWGIIAIGHDWLNNAVQLSTDFSLVAVSSLFFFKNFYFIFLERRVPRLRPSRTFTGFSFQVASLVDGVRSNCFLSTTQQEAKKQKHKCCA